MSSIFILKIPFVLQQNIDQEGKKIALEIYTNGEIEIHKVIWYQNANKIILKFCDTG